jgi:hypothetical protein
MSVFSKKCQVDTRMIFLIETHMCSDSRFKANDSASCSVSGGCSRGVLDLAGSYALH